MAIIGIKLDRNLIIHCLVVLILQSLSFLLFKTVIFGFIFAIGILFGREISQVEYRAIAKGKKWDDLSIKDYFTINNWKAKDGGLLDTILDVIIPTMIGGILWIMIK